MMTEAKLTIRSVQLGQRDVEVLRFIRNYDREHGYAPSLREICEACGFRSKSVASHYVERLIATGRLRRGPKRTPRSLSIVEVPDGLRHT